MNRHDPLLDRFFERQRREILARIERRRSRRPSRAALAALAAAAALLLAGGLALLSSGPAERTESAWLWELPLPLDEAGTETDLLAAFDPWGGTPSETQPLPPLPDESEPALESIPDVRL